jgi:hypothetical protein
MNEFKEDPAHEQTSCWKYGLFYYDEDNPRLIVPKRVKWAGWTINTAHPQSWLVLLALLAVLLVPIAVEIALGVATPVIVIPTVIVSILVVSFVAHIASRKH